VVVGGMDCSTPPPSAPPILHPSPRRRPASPGPRAGLLGLLALLVALAAACSDVSISQRPEAEGDEPGECSDDADNDADGLFDCDDPDCAGAAACAPDDDDTAPDDDDSAVDDDDTAPDDDDTAPDDDDSAADDDDDSAADDDDSAADDDDAVDDDDTAPDDDDSAAADDDDTVPDDDDAADDDDTALPPDGVYDVPGEHTFVVPAAVTSLQVAAWGGGGAGGNQIGATGGAGAYASVEIPVTAGETLTLLVAEGGDSTGDGAGATYILRGAAPLLIVAGGGGGGSDGCSGCKSGGRGGAGGGFVGQDGQDLLVGFNGYCDAATGGRGGDASSGGSGGSYVGTAQYPCNGQPGGPDHGGEATGTFGTCQTTGGADRWESGGGQGNGGGGGGGAGWRGGGGAGFIWTYCSGGGGGGSSWSDPANTAVSLLDGTWDQPAVAGAGVGGPVGGLGSPGRIELSW
jgi:hypothetical protein